jgi:hypothetical protein
MLTEPEYDELMDALILLRRAFAGPALSIDGVLKWAVASSNPDLALAALRVRQLLGASEAPQ